MMNKRFGFEQKPSLISRKLKFANQYQLKRWHNINDTNINCAVCERNGNNI